MNANSTRYVVGVDYGLVALDRHGGNRSVLAAAYPPDKERADAYDRLCAEYRTLHDHFTIGESSAAAVKAAVTCEDLARTVRLSRRLGQPPPNAPDDVDNLYDHYQNVYGQRSHR